MAKLPFGMAFGLMKKNVLVPGVSACHCPWVSPATSFEHALSQLCLSGPVMRWLFSNWSPVIGHWTALIEYFLFAIFFCLSDEFLSR